MNIFLLISDSFRYDNLHSNPVMTVRTPELDRFAERAVSFSAAYTSSFPTIPHRTDLTTGRFGWPWYSWQDRLESGPNHAPQLLTQAGYVTQLICDCPHLFGAHFHSGFHAAHALRGQEADLHLLRMNYPVEHVMPPEKTRDDCYFEGGNLVDIARWENRHWRGEADRFPPRTAAVAVEWLEENYLHDPLFLWLDFFDPHEPWDPPEYMVRRHDPDYCGTAMIHPNYGYAHDYTDAELHNLRAHYCAEAELVDRWVGRVLQKIDDLDLWKNSIVIFTSDHGISLGEHDRTGKSNINRRDGRRWPLYPEIAQVPLLIAAPDLEGGRTVDALIQTPDLQPTIADLAGVELSPTEPFHGKSFAPLLRGDASEHPRQIAIVAAHLRLTGGDSIDPNASTPVVYTRQWAYCPFGPDGRRELFDLSRDPYCQTNVLPAHSTIADDLHTALLTWLADLHAPPEALAPFQ